MRDAKTVRPSSRRLTRAAATRCRQTRLKVHRLMVHLTGRHTYAQIVAPDAKVLVSASTAEREMREILKGKGADINAAVAIGARIADKAGTAAEKLATEKLAFDRGGRQYHGRVRALAMAARDGGLKF